MRSRTVECKIYLEYSKTELSIPESECLEEAENGIVEKPVEVEECFADDRCEGEEGPAGEPQQLSQIEYTISSSISERSRRPKVELSYQVLNETTTALPTTTALEVVHASVHLYTWRVSGFGACSHRCLGGKLIFVTFSCQCLTSREFVYFFSGTQESIYSCFRIADNVSVHANYCQGQIMPELYTRTCNDQPCPPR